MGKTVMDNITGVHVVTGCWMLLLVLAGCSDARSVCDRHLVHATYLACGIAKRSLPSYDPSTRQAIDFVKRLENSDDFRGSVESLVGRVHRVLKFAADSPSPDHDAFQHKLSPLHPSDSDHDLDLHSQAAGQGRGGIIDRCCWSHCTIEDMAGVC